MESIFKLSEQGFGVHTFEIKFNHMTQEEYHTIKDRIIRISEKDKEDKCLIVKTHSKSGIRIKLYKNKPFPPYLTVIVNPSTVLGFDDPHSILKAFDKSRLKETLDEELKSYLGYKFGIERFQLTRIDCTVDFIMSSPELSSYYIKLVSKSIRLNTSSDTFGFYEDNAAPYNDNISERDKHCFRVTQNGYYSLTVYDKLYDLINKGYLDNRTVKYGLLRFEIALMYRKINEVKASLNAEDIIELVSYFTKNAENILKMQLKNKIVSGNYYKISKIYDLLQEPAHKSAAAQRLATLYSLNNKFCTYNDLKKDALDRFGKYKLRDIEDLRKQLNTSPAVLPDYCSYDVLPGIYDMFDIDRNDK